MYKHAAQASEFFAHSLARRACMFLLSLPFRWAFALLRPTLQPFPRSGISPVVYGGVGNRSLNIL